jgi:hypothetical protein
MGRGRGISEFMLLISHLAMITKFSGLRTKSQYFTILPFLPFYVKLSTLPISNILFDIFPINDFLNGVNHSFLSSSSRSATSFVSSISGFSTFYKIYSLSTPLAYQLEQANKSSISSGLKHSCSARNLILV